MSEIVDRTIARRLEALEGEIEAQRLRLRHLENLQRSASGDWSIGRFAEEKAIPKNDINSGPKVRDKARSDGAEPGEDRMDGRWRPSLPDGLLGLRSWEWWLNKVGIGLLLFGVVSLFKFSVDQGWLVPGLRVGIGLCIGIALVIVGLRVYVGRRAFSHTLLGGGIGVFYITGFAAFQLYGLISYPVAITFMVAVTLLAFGLSLRQSGVALALIAGSGGFGTPFLLYTDSGSLGGLVLYTCLILTGVCAIYLHKGWRSLLLFSSLAVWTIFFEGYEEDINHLAPWTSGDRAYFTLGVAFAWLSLSGVSVAREILRFKYPERWSFPGPGPVTGRLFASDEEFFRSGIAAYLLTVFGPFLALFFMVETWSMKAESAVFLTVGGAAVYALAAILLRRVVGGGWLSYFHALVALALSTLSLFIMLEGNALFFALVAEAALLHLVSRRLSDKILSASAHLLFIVVGIWLLERVVIGALDGAFVPEGRIFFDLGAWVDLLAIALAFGVSMFVVSGPFQRIYGISAHVVLLGVIWRELAAFPDSGAYISLAWGAYAVGLVVVGLRLTRTGLMRLGLATLFVVVGKLFLVDLAWVGTVWRILLFLGFGGVFLFLSYYLQRLWRPGKPEDKISPGAS